MYTTQVLTAALLAAPPEPQPLSRAELVTTDGSSILYAYDDDDHVAAEIAISVDGLQASFDGLFIDAALAADGTVMAVECGGKPCSDADLRNAHAQLGAVAELLIQSPPAAPEALDLGCALTIAGGGIACAGTSGAWCLASFYLAACECMGSIVIKGKDICDEIF
jgi:hypothetical protein